MKSFSEDPGPWQNNEAELHFELDENLCVYCSSAFKGILNLEGELGSSFRDKRSRGPHLLRHHDGTLRALQHSSNTCMTCHVIEQFITDGIKLHGARWPALNDGYYRVFFEPESDSAIEVLIRVSTHEPPSTKSGADWPSRLFKCFLFMQDSFQDPFWVTHGPCQIRPKTQKWPLLQTRLHNHAGSEAQLQLAKTCLEQCKDYDFHPRCHRVAQELPKRILDIGIEFPPKVVILQDGNGRIEDYVCLSYSWGSSPPLCTTGDSIKDHVEGIAFSNLPQTLKDAVHLTSYLGFRYIWIDALCIVQDDKQDWAEHGPIMAKIYNNSALTVSATSSADCKSGIFTQMANLGVQIGSFYHQEEGNYRRPLFFDRFRFFTLERQHLFTRGWTFQEQLVSSRVLHYTDRGIAWVCFTRYWDQLKSEHPAVYNTLWAEQNALYKSIADAPQHDPFSAIVKRKMAYSNWHRWIRDYSDRNLTYLNDKLPAMAGVAAHFSTNMQTTYLAGLWKENFVSDLLWEREGASLSVHRHSGVAPSWSWASVSGVLSYDLEHYLPAGARYDVCIWNVDVHEKVPGSFGQVNDGYITADGWMQETRVVRLSFLEFSISHEHSAESGFVKGTTVVCRLDKFEEDDIEAKWCWALRIGLFVPLHESSDPVPRIAMLLLERVEPAENIYRRIGVAYTLPTYQGGGPLPEDICTSGVWQRVVIV